MTASCSTVPSSCRQRVLAAAVLALGVAALAACAAPRSDSLAEVNLGDRGPYAGSTVEGVFTLPEVTFTDTAGEAFRLRADTRDPVTLLFFGYTSCPDICNAVLADVAAALRRVDPAVRESTRLVFVTTDPARDTGPAIRAYLDRFDPSYVGLRAPMPTVRSAAAELGVALTGKEKLPGGGYEVGHGTQVTAFGPDERSLVLWMPGTPVADLRHDFSLLTREANAATATASPAR